MEVTLRLGMSYCGMSVRDDQTGVVGGSVGVFGRYWDGGYSRTTR